MKSKSVHLESHCAIKASREEIYKIMTDFEKLPEYFPSVAKSVKIISRIGNDFVVEAKTKAFLGSGEFAVRMEGRLQPPKGFVSTNTSAICIEHESFLMEEVPEGTMINYTNDVEIKNPFFCAFSFLITFAALRYWQRAVFNKLKLMLENKTDPAIPA